MSNVLVLLAALTAVAPPPEQMAEMAFFNWSCNNPEAVQLLNDLDDNRLQAEKFLADGTCVFFQGGSVGGPIFRTIKTYVHKDGSVNSILEVGGPGDRDHFVVVEDERTF